MSKMNITNDKKKIMIIIKYGFFSVFYRVVCQFFISLNPSVRQDDSIVSAVSKELETNKQTDGHKSALQKLAITVQSE